MGGGSRAGELFCSRARSWARPVSCDRRLGMESRRPKAVNSISVLNIILETEDRQKELFEDEAWKVGAGRQLNWNFKADQDPPLWEL